MDRFSEGYQAGVDDFWEALQDFSREWWRMKLLDDRQYIGVLELKHALDLRFNYVMRGNSEQV